MNLNNHSKAWIYNKLQGYYRRELHFQGLDISFHLSIFKFCLFESNNFQELKDNLKKYNVNDCLKFVRKKEDNGNKLYFSYPSLSFQAESLFYCWDEILTIQEQTGEDISKAIKYQRDLKFMEDEDSSETENSILDTERFCYGNKPNPAVRLKPFPDKSLQENEERKVFPISIDFKYEYNSFRQSVISKCENMIREKNKDVIFIQTDIKTFFHTLQIDPLTEFIKNKFPDAKNLYKYLKELKSKFKYDSLPIGWTLSRFIADIISQEFHNKFNECLSAKFQNSLKNKLSSKIELKHKISYVDDFIFLITIPDGNKDISKKEITKTLLEEANKLLNSVLENNKALQFHGADSEKTKSHQFNKDNISTLKTNFAFFNKADDYDDSEIAARVDDILLAADNDIALNENQHFHRNLKGLQKIVVGNRYFKEKEINDLLAQIRIKIEKTGSRYIKSAFRLFYFLELSEISDEVKKKIREEEIPSIFDKLKENYNFSFEWIRFFNGYFNFLRSIEYQDVKRLFELLSKVTESMEEDDKALFQLLKNEYVFKMSLTIQSKQQIFKNGLFDNSKNITGILSKLSDQRERAIRFLEAAISSQNEDNLTEMSKVLKPIDLTWTSIVLGQILKRNHKIKAEQIFAIIEKFKNESGILNFSFPQIITSYLPFNTKSNQSVFIEQMKKYDLKDSYFWRITSQLIKNQTKIANYYKLNEKKRLEKILKTLNQNNSSRYLSKKTPDIIWAFVKKSFSSEKNQICAYFIANRLNNESEFVKYILTAAFKMESSQLTPWSTLPLTLQKTGIYINLMIKKLFEIEYNKESKFAEIIEDIISALNKMKIKKIEKFISQKYFGVNIVNLDLLPEQYKDNKIKNKPFKITIAPLSLNLEKDLDYKKGLKFKSKAEKMIDFCIKGAIDEAVRQESSILIFPELSIPRNYLASYLKKASEQDIVLIGGLEYFTDLNQNAYNSTVVSIPVKRSLNPGGREYFAFEQIKNFPASKESYYLNKYKFKYKNGSGIFIFKSDFWGDFAVLTCSDFLSLGLRWILQGEIQTVFVPAQNTDSTTYDHTSETSIRELHCVTIVCNNSQKGNSHCYAPYYDRSKRAVFKKIGISKPEYHTFTIDNLKEIKKTQQEADPTAPFRNPDPKNDGNEYPYSKYKQLPPDWRFWDEGKK